MEQLIKNLTLVTTGKFGNYCEAITGFSSLEHAQKTMRFYASESSGHVEEQDDNFRIETEDRVYNIVYSKPLNAEIPTTRKTFSELVFEEADRYYKLHTGFSISSEQFEIFSGNDIKTLEDLSDCGDEFDNTMVTDAFEQAIELWEAIEGKD